MSVCGSSQHMFEKPSLPENPTLIESFSGSQIKQPLYSFTDLFGELHFKENPIHHTNAVSNITPRTCTPHKRSDSFSSLGSESLHVCTEGLGFESSDDGEEWKKEVRDLESDEREKDGGIYYGKKRLGLGEHWRRRVSSAYRVEYIYPPPISCMGNFISYRNNGRFVLKKIRTPSQEFLRAHREDGRLKLHIVQNDEDEEFMAEEEGDDYDGADGDNHGEADEAEVVEMGEENLGKENC
ncbi:The fantastic four family [Vigna unguiculata]|uniref:The fantastic four family n=1 Tax=Vigna unguiculata TaxID=3917 RepID=A0A4D6LHB2_VIGUN|nr:The fantastic four family [Vigna unguiculata]